MKFKNIHTGHVVEVKNVVSYQEEYGEYVYIDADGVYDLDDYIPIGAHAAWYE